MIPDSPPSLGLSSSIEPQIFLPKCNSILPPPHLRLLVSPASFHRSSLVPGPTPRQKTPVQLLLPLPWVLHHSWCISKPGRELTEARAADAFRRQKSKEQIANKATQYRKGHSSSSQSPEQPQMGWARFVWVHLRIPSSKKLAFNSLQKSFH